MTESATNCAAHAYRKAIGWHVFPEEAARILDKILFYGLESGRYTALIPTQQLFCVLCKVSKGKVSDWLKWLEAQRVIERQQVEVIVNKQSKWWTSYALNPPAQWGKEVLLRPERPGLAEEIDAWLKGLDTNQPELLPPPLSLSELLRENFAGSVGPGENRIEPLGAYPNRPADGSPGGNPVSIESSGKDAGEATFVSIKVSGVSPEGTSQVPQEGTSQVPQEGTSQVPQEGTVPRARVDPDPDRLIESRKHLTRSGSIESRGGDTLGSPGGNSDPDYRAYVEERLFTAIGWSERGGQAGWIWKRSLDLMPDRVDELISVALERKRLGRFTRTKSANPVAAYLNTALRSEFLERRVM